MEKRINVTSKVEGNKLESSVQTSELMPAEANEGYNDEKRWGIIKDLIKESELLHLGLYYSDMILKDIKHLAFTLSRYKFASKLLMYKDSVDLLEMGCQEALGALMFKQNVKLSRYVGIDLDAEAIKWNRKYLSSEFEFINADFFDCEELKTRQFDAVVSLDVIEHISSDMENQYCEVISSNLKEDGVAIIGTPSIMLSPYACEASRVGHINLYDQERLYRLMSEYFGNVFIFNMNDEVVNTGFAPMACYIFAVCCNKK